MSHPIPDSTRLSISRLDSALTRTRLQKIESVVAVVPKGSRSIAWNSIPSAAALRQLERRKRGASGVASAQLSLANKANTAISLARLESGLSTFATLGFARQVLAQAMATNPSSIALVVSGFDQAGATAVADAFCAAALAASDLLPSRKSKPKKPPRLRRLILTGEGEPDIDRLLAEHRGNYLARWLTTLPPNELDSKGYREHVTKLAKHYGWQHRFLDSKALEKAGAGAFLAVSRAGDPDAGIVHLQYRPGNRKDRADLALVGKGIVFDTGGVNVKPANYMKNMHEDMQGSAVALGVLTTLTEMQSPLAVDCWLAISENLIGRQAYKPMEVVTAVNGTTIEIMHTDAEGRMVLADTLALAAAEKPAAILDYATLTGACIGAITERYSGVFTNRPALNQVLIRAGEGSGERVWPFPMDKDFDEDLRSPIADVRQCRLIGGGDHIYAARFLSRFVEKVPWVHMDLASGRRKGGLAHIGTDVTGFGVRFTLNLLHEQRMLEVIS